MFLFRMRPSESQGKKIKGKLQLLERRKPHPIKSDAPSHSSVFLLYWNQPVRTENVRNKNTAVLILTGLIITYIIAACHQGNKRLKTKMYKVG